MRLEIGNSFCKLHDPDPATEDLVNRLLSYKQDFEAERRSIYGRKKRINYVLRNAKDKKTRDKLRKSLENCDSKLRWMKENEWVFWYKNQTFPTGHLNLVLEAFKKTGTTFEVEDLRRDPRSSVRLDFVTPPYEPRYYQKKMIDEGLKAQRGIFEAAVGTGKSLVMTYLIHELSCISLVVVPSKGLLNQLKNELSHWFGSDKVQCVSSSEVRKGEELKPIRVVTIQTLAALLKSGDLQNLVQDVEALYVDEIHHAGAVSYTNLLGSLDHVFYRFGFTGTFIRNDSRILDMWGFLSNVLYRYKAADAIEEGFLTPLEIRAYELTGVSHKEYKKEYDANYGNHSEFLNTVAQIVEANPEDQVLILVALKEKCGDVIHQYLNSCGIENTYISGDNSKEEITEAISSFNEKRCRVLVGSSVIGEGIDVRSTNHLVMAQGGKSEIVMVQAVGRAVRLYEGKHKAYVHDFYFSGTKYMTKHFKQRENIYLRNFDCDVRRM
jgi:superfamily II DNA or RNA helicase